MCVCVCLCVCVCVCVLLTCICICTCVCVCVCLCVCVRARARACVLYRVCDVDNTKCVCTENSCPVVNLVPNVSPLYTLLPPQPLPPRVCVVVVVGGGLGMFFFSALDASDQCIYACKCGWVGECGSAGVFFLLLVVFAFFLSLFAAIYSFAFFCIRVCCNTSSSMYPPPQSILLLKGRVELLILVCCNIFFCFFF